jgi:hypothetical protein
MHRSLRFLAASAAGVVLLSQAAAAQDTATATYGQTIISVGGGAQFVDLPDIDFTFKTNNAGNTVSKQKNSELGDYGGAFAGSIETPFGYWGGTPVSGIVSGFFSNVSDSDTTRCFSSRFAFPVCGASNLVDNPNGPDSRLFSSFTTNASRDVDYWGVGGEARFGKPQPIPESGGYLFRFSYWGVGTDFRAFDQNNHLRIDSPDTGGLAMTYNEQLDTDYWGGYLTIGGRFDILGFFSVGESWGFNSSVALRAGLYDASTDYNGRSNLAGVGTSQLGLSDDRAAFIGGATFETRKQFGPRTSLSLVTDYEYYSYAPKMRYLDADIDPINGTASGRVARTGITDNDALEVRTTLRLNIGLGPSTLYPPQ